MLVEIEQGLDETGAPEEFTWDLFPLVDASETLHLDESGLPRVGSTIRAGMILVGKIARTRDYDPGRQPTALAIHGLDRKELAETYGSMWKNTAFYADEARSGVVRAASFIQRRGVMVASIELDPSDASVIDRIAELTDDPARVETRSGPRGMTVPRGVGRTPAHP